MSEKKIVVPAGMRRAALGSNGAGFALEIGCVDEVDKALEAALRWLDGELEKMLKGDPYKGDTMRSESMNENAVRTGFNKAIEEVRRIFLAPDPEVPEAIKDLRRIRLASVKDQDDLDKLVRALNVAAYHRGQKAGQ